MIRRGLIRLNGGTAKPEALLEVGDKIEIPMFLCEAESGSPWVETTAQGADSIKTMILAETEDLLILNKPAGVLVHGSHNSLEAKAQRHLGPRMPPSLSFVPGPLHRLDRNTSGVIVFSKSIIGAKSFTESMQAGKIRKTYLAILQGRMEGNYEWEDYVLRDEKSRKSTATPFHQDLSVKALPRTDRLGQKALTSVHTILSNQAHSFVALRIKTGRTHQIRSQAAARGYPLAGDFKYGALRQQGNSSDKRVNYFLHAWRLEIQGVPMEIKAPIPKNYLQIIKKIFALDEKEVYSLLRQSKI